MVGLSVDVDETASASEGGTWMTPEQALARAQALGFTPSTGASGLWCLWRGLKVA
jgi:hypothetical protein